MKGSNKQFYVCKNGVSFANFDIFIINLKILIKLNGLIDNLEHFILNYFDFHRFYYSCFLRYYACIIFVSFNFKY